MSFGLEPFVLKVVLIQLAGFACLLIGNFIYNEIIEVKFCGFDQQLRRYINQDNSVKADTVEDN